MFSKQKKEVCIYNSASTSRSVTSGNLYFIKPIPQTDANRTNEVVHITKRQQHEHHPLFVTTLFDETGFLILGNSTVNTFTIFPRGLSSESVTVHPENSFRSASQRAKRSFVSSMPSIMHRVVPVSLSSCSDPSDIFGISLAVFALSMSIVSMYEFIPAYTLFMNTRCVFVSWHCVEAIFFEEGRVFYFFLLFKKEQLQKHLLLTIFIFSRTFVFFSLQDRRCCARALRCARSTAPEKKSTVYVIDTMTREITTAVT